MLFTASSARPSPRIRLTRTLIAAAAIAALVAGCSTTATAPPQTSAQTSAAAPSSQAPESSAPVDAAPSTSSPASSAAESESATSAPASSPESSTSASSTSASSTTASSTTSSSTTSSSGGATDGADCITDFDAAKDYFPEKVETTESNILTFKYFGSYAVVSIAPGTSAPEHYVLLRCGAPTPTMEGDLAGAPVIQVPVTSLYSASTSHLPSLVMLDRLDVLTGVSSQAFVSQPEVLAHFKSAKVAEFAPMGQTDAEAVIKGKPQVLVGGGFPDPADEKIAKAGIPVINDIDATEATPLGQAEWIKLFGALTGTEAAATAKFDAIVADYNKTKQLVSGDKIKVVAGQPYQGTWYVPGGNSWKNRLISDAGGSTGFEKDPSTSSIATTFEKVFATSAKAPVWLASTTWTSEAQALKEEPRFAKFAAFAAHNVWNPVKGTTEAGGNPAYELGPARPDLMLADLVAILHPDKLPGHEFTFYVKLK